MKMSKVMKWKKEYEERNVIFVNNQYSVEAQWRKYEEICLY